MSAKFPGFKKCMNIMRSRIPQEQEDGFHYLSPRTHEHVHELIEEFGKEDDPGVRCWILELVGDAKSPECFETLAQHLKSPDQSLRRWAIRGLKLLDTKSARRLLWDARSYELGSKEETAELLRDLDAPLPASGRGVK